MTRKEYNAARYQAFVDGVMIVICAGFAFCGVAFIAAQVL
jgi:hypothetical protein